MTKIALVTGAAGFVGRHLAKHLYDEGLVVHGLDQPGVPVPTELDLEWHPCNVSDAAQVAEVIGQVQPDYVFHLAALLKSESLADLLAVNVIGTQNVLDTLVAVCPETRVLLTSSSAEYGMVRPEELPVKEENPLRPLSPYGVSKVAQGLLATQYTYRHNLAVICTRTFNLTGPGGPDTSVCSAFARQIAEIERGLRPPVMKVGNLEANRDFVDVRDAVQAYWLAVQRGMSGDVFNVCSGEAISVRHMLELLLSLTSIKVDVEEEASLYTLWDVPMQVGDRGRLELATGWVPAISIHQSLSDLLSMWRMYADG